MEILLGSGSPRRRELMALMDIGYRVIAIHDVEEIVPEGTPAKDVPVYLSRLKASAYANELTDGQLLVTADTVVILDGDILGKPTDEADAVRMLKRLSGRTHRVVTGVTLTTTNGSETFSETTEVEFVDLDEATIKTYVERYRPLDKAGAYGIQEFIGIVGVKSIKGCFYNVMGLPTPSLYLRLKRYL